MFPDSREELAQNKLLLLYVIKKAPYAFSKDELTEYILERNLLNYFSIQQYINELLESGFVELTVENKYKTLEKGIEALSYFDSKIPSKLKSQIKEDFKLEETEKQMDTQVVAEYYEKENGQYMVSLKLVENEEVLFSLYLSVASEEQAILISNSWKSKTDSIYMNIMNMFIN